MAYGQRTLRGTYSPLNFPLPSNSLAQMPAAVAAVKAAANLAVKGKRPGMSGAYGPPAQRWPGAYSRRGMPVLGLGDALDPIASAGIDDAMNWVKANPLLAAGIAAGAMFFLSRSGRR